MIYIFFVEIYIQYNVSMLYDRIRGESGFEIKTGYGRLSIKSYIIPCRKPG